jgi:hypothetical protein
MLLSGNRLQNSSIVVFPTAHPKAFSIPEGVIGLQAVKQIDIRTAINAFILFISTGINNLPSRKW